MLSTNVELNNYEINSLTEHAVVELFIVPIEELFLVFKI